MVALVFMSCSGSGDSISQEVPAGNQQTACETPSDLKFQAIYNIFSWYTSDNQGIGYYQVQYGEQGFALGTGTVYETSNKSFSAPLYSGKKYDFYVRKNCGTSTGWSNWAGPITILSNNTTACVKPTFANHTVSTSSVYSPTFSASISWDNDGISVYEVALSMSSTGPAPGTWSLINAPSMAAYTNLDKYFKYYFYVRKRCADNSFTEYYGPYEVKWP